MAIPIAVGLAISWCLKSRAQIPGLQLINPQTFRHFRTQGNGCFRCRYVSKGRKLWKTFPLRQRWKLGLWVIELSWFLGILGYFIGQLGEIRILWRLQFNFGRFRQWRSCGNLRQNGELGKLAAEASNLVYTGSSDTTSLVLVTLIDVLASLLITI